MTVRMCYTGLINLMTVAACTTAAVLVVLVVKWGLTQVWPEVSIHARLVIGLAAPLVVVLLGLLVEQAGKVAERVLLRAA